MLALRFDLFPIAILLMLGVSIEVVARVLFPGRFADRRSKWLMRLAVFALAVLILSFEMLARARAPIGGGAWRVLVSIERCAVIVVWVSAVGLALWHGLLELVGRVRLARRARATIARAEQAEAPSSAAKTESIEPEAPAPADTSEELPTRRDTLSRAVNIGIVAATSTYVGYGLIKGRRDLRVREEVFHLPKLPRALEGYTIVQLTDVHYGIYTGEEDMRPIIERTLALRPDLIVLTGDLIDRHPRHIADALRSITKLRARDGVLSILGNHDYYAGFEAVLSAMNRTDIRTLINEHTVIRPGDQGGFTLAGVDDFWAYRVVPGRDCDVRLSLEGSSPDRAKVLLAHNPKVFHRAKTQADLQLSGHTHGGQINPGSMMKLALDYVSGVYREGESTLFVSNGLGFTGPPVRLSAPPEIAKIVLVR
ncbi:MAG: metallophosphoesterase [Polyangiales bacterium]